MGSRRPLIVEIQPNNKTKEPKCVFEYGMGLDLTLMRLSRDNLHIASAWCLPPHVSDATWPIGNIQRFPSHLTMAPTPLYESPSMANTNPTLGRRRMSGSDSHSDMR